MRREGKAGPFIPSEVWAQTGSARATTPAVAHRRRRATTAVGTRAKAYPLGQRRLRSGGNAYAWARTHACGRQHLRPCDDRCRVGGVFFHKPPKLQRSGDDVCVRATTFGSFFSNIGIFSCFGNPIKTFPLSLFENYWNCIEDGNPKLFLLVGVFLSALKHDLPFLSRHLSI